MLQEVVNEDIKYYTGGKRDPPDPRDHRKRYGEAMIPSKDVHPKVDLRMYIDEIYDQGPIHNCTANTLCAAFSLELKRQAKEQNQTYFQFVPSRLFLFYNSRICDDTTDTDTGVSLRFALMAAHYMGFCGESFWPYKVENVTVKPPLTAYQAAFGNSIAKYERLDQDIDQFRACLKAGFPFAFGFEIYSNFRDLDNDHGIMPMPSAEDLANYEPGRHAVLAVGYDDTTQLITVLNSWGKRFGDNGYFYMPYKYITEDKRAYDFWKIEDVAGKSNPTESIKKKFRDILNFDLWGN